MNPTLDQNAQDPAKKKKKKKNMPCMNQVQYCVDEAGTQLKHGSLSALSYFKKGLQNILQSLAYHLAGFTYTLFQAIFLSFKIKYTIVIVSLVVLVMHLGTFPSTRLCQVYFATLLKIKHEALPQISHIFYNVIFTRIKIQIFWRTLLMIRVGNMRDLAHWYLCYKHNI